MQSMIGYMSKEQVDERAENKPEGESFRESVILDRVELKEEEINTIIKVP